MKTKKAKNSLDTVFVSDSVKHNCDRIMLLLRKIEHDASLSGQPLRLRLDGLDLSWKPAQTTKGPAK